MCGGISPEKTWEVSSRAFPTHPACRPGTGKTGQHGNLNCNISDKHLSVAASWASPGAWGSSDTVLDLTCSNFRVCFCPTMEAQYKCKSWLSDSFSKSKKWGPCCSWRMLRVSGGAVLVKNMNVKRKKGCSDTSGWFNVYFLSLP